MIKFENNLSVKKKEIYTIPFVGTLTGPCAFLFVTFSVLVM